MIGQMAIAIALLGFNDLSGHWGHLHFFTDTDYIYYYTL